MKTIWMTPVRDVSWQDYSKLARVLGWREGEPFHPSDSASSETAYVAADGTRIAVYCSRGWFSGPGVARIAAYGPDPEATADAIARHLPTRDRTIEAAFHRLDVANASICATAAGAWWIHSRGHLVRFLAAGPERNTAAVTVYSPFALAAGDRAVYVTSCDDPRASQLVRIDGETMAAESLCELDRPGSLAVIDDVAYVAVAGGLVAVDRTGAIEPRPLEVPHPFIMTKHRDALYWIDATRKNVVEYREGRGRVVATGNYLSGLDVDDDGLYLLDGYALTAIVGGRARSFELEQWTSGRAGVVRLGPLLVTMHEADTSYQTFVRKEWVMLGYPQLAEAPRALTTEALDDDHAREVLVDFLADRGVHASADVLRRVLASPTYTSSDDRGTEDMLPNAPASCLATYDRETGYFASSDSLDVFSVDDLLA